MSEETCVTGVQVSSVLVYLGNHNKSFLTGMREECRKLVSKFLGDACRAKHNFVPG